MNTYIGIELGQVNYLDAWELQKDLHRRVAQGTLPGVLLLLEHPPVYTLGRRAQSTDILASPEWLNEQGVEVCHVDRGGQATYHGPGQLVGYPIVNLGLIGGGPIKYVRSLEQVLVATLAELGVAGECSSRPTGVWVDDAKIAAIGVKISRGVTTHGFALNVDPDLTFFDHIVPCGIPAGRVTSIAAERPGDIDVRRVISVLARHFGNVLGITIEWITLERLGQAVQSGSLGL